MIKDVLCPECNKESLHKMGFVISGRRKVQRYMCNACYRTTMKPLVKAETETLPSQSLVPVSKDNICNALQC